MGQFKIFSSSEFIVERRMEISNAIHDASVSHLGLPKAQRFHRFIPLESADFVYPQDRSDHYTIIEAIMFEGRTSETRKSFIRNLYERWIALGEDVDDLEIVLLESPRSNWGIRGQLGDEMQLDYKVNK